MCDRDCAELGDSSTLPARSMSSSAATAQTWAAVSGFDQITDVAPVPAARRVVVTTVARGVFVYDVDAHRVIACK